MQASNTTATTDADLLALWLQAHADGSLHTRRLYARIAGRFLAALAAAGTDLRRATLDDVLAALDGLRAGATRAPLAPASLSTYVAAVKSLLGFAHTVGFTRFNAGPLIKIKRAPRLLAPRLLDEADIRLLIRAARSERDRLMLEVAYTGALRVSELLALTWKQILPRDSGEAQLALVGKGSKARNILLPADVAARLLASRNGAQPEARVFPIRARMFNYLVKRAARDAGINPAASAHWLRHAHASHALDNGAPISLVSQTLGHADIKTTSVYAHARPTDSSSRYLKRG